MSKHGRLIDADALNSIKFHPLPYTHIVPDDVNAESYQRGWNDAIDVIVENAPTIEPERKPGQWIPCSERLPECEQEVLICTKKKIVGKNAYIDSIITPAIYEDGTMLENDSKWRWVDMDYAGWDEEEDCGIIPEGWWENRHFYPDGDYNNVVDREVVAWMPLPDPYKEGANDEPDE